MCLSNGVLHINTRTAHITQICSFILSFTSIKQCTNHGLLATAVSSLIWSGLRVLSCYGKSDLLNSPAPFNSFTKQEQCLHTTHHVFFYPSFSLSLQQGRCAVYEDPHCNEVILIEMLDQIYDQIMLQMQNKVATPDLILCSPSLIHKDQEDQGKLCILVCPSTPYLFSVNFAPSKDLFHYS